MHSDEIIEDYDLTDKTDKNVITNKDIYNVNNIYGSNIFRADCSDIENKRYIVLVGDNIIKITDRSINKEPQSISDPFYFGCVVEAVNEHFAIFEAGKAYKDLENS